MSGMGIRRIRTATEDFFSETVLTTAHGDAMRESASGGRARICHLAKRSAPAVSMAGNDGLRQARRRLS